MWMKRFQIYLMALIRGSHRHFWKVKKVSYRVFSENYSPLKELVVTLRWCSKRSYIDVGTSTRSLYLKFRELLDIPLCSY
ncbi:hypothetical protein Goshw_010727 [Gossypium schwendimanii]|uniref:Uncharacterized protein n=1 Tax=Gossypium schwendimanii TaxID=34291 RepID=A0A7J9N3H0_GOSSC|nr:hypothetical protein [Gossypium schwendimanii]